MEEKTKTIIEFDFQLIANFYKRFDRQGPGSKDVTLKALSFIDNLPHKPKIADIGCGTGGQTIYLAENTSANIVAIDLMEDFTTILNNKVKDLGFQDRISVINGSMDNLPFSDNELDLIWAEGSIYNVGYEKGLAEWRRLLKDDGYIAVSEASWFTESRPAEIEKFWDINYPQIDTIPVKIQQMEKAGYVSVAHFILPEYCWLDEFFAPIENGMNDFLADNNYSEAAKELIEYEKHEIALYKKYKQYYGYVFYIGKKI